MIESVNERVTRVTVSGSFTKHWDKMQDVTVELRDRGAEVLSPINGPPLREADGFVFLREDVGSPDALEWRHLEAIRRSDLLYIVNPGGYLGNSVALEIGYALAWHTPIWSLEPFQEIPHRLLVRSGGLGEALEAVRRELSLTMLPDGADVDELQAYIAKVATLRGFSEEQPHEVLILLMEEVGELAKAVRTRLRLAMSATDSSGKNISLELADCFIYILHFANQAGVKLLAAFREKEHINASKKWPKV